MFSWGCKHATIGDEGEETGEQQYGERSAEGNMEMAIPETSTRDRETKPEGSCQTSSSVRMLLNGHYKIINWSGKMNLQRPGRCVHNDAQYKTPWWLYKEYQGSNIYV
jgi:hypothetical protein